MPNTGARLLRGLTTLPDAPGWGFSVLIGGVVFALIAAIGFSTGLFRVENLDLAGLPLRAVSAFFLPALGEELVFRGLLVPDRSETSRPWIAIALTTATYIAWHMVETFFLRHAAPIFLRPDFLACAAILGVGCATVRWRTSSLWPAVALHWLAVVVWQTWLGGPGIAALK